MPGITDRNGNKKSVQYNGIGTPGTVATWISNNTIGSSLSLAEAAFSDSLVESLAKSLSIQRLGGFLSPYCFNGRLTLTQGTPVTTSNVSSASSIYLEPYRGNRISLFDGTRWNEYALVDSSNNSGQVFSINRTISCTTVSGSPTITINSGDTFQLFRGMEVTGTGISGTATISSIPTATTVVLSSNATSSATNNLTFQAPGPRTHDVFCVDRNGTPTLQFGNIWTENAGAGANTRVDALGLQDGIYCNNAAINASDYNAIPAKMGRYIGTIRTIVDGFTHDRATDRLIWNMYNKVQRSGVSAYNVSHTYTTAAWRAFGSIESYTSISFVIGLVEESILGSYYFVLTYAAGQATMYAGIGWNTSTGQGGAVANTCFACPGTIGLGGVESYMPTNPGFHFGVLIEYSGNPSGTFWQGNFNLFLKN